MSGRSSDGYVTVATLSDVPTGGALRVEAGQAEIAIFNVGGEIFATDDICSHEEASLSEGELFDHQVECPLHGARFDVRTGRALTLPAVRPVKTYPVRVVDGNIEVQV